MQAPGRRSVFEHSHNRGSCQKAENGARDVCLQLPVVGFIIGYHELLVC